MGGWQLDLSPLRALAKTLRSWLEAIVEPLRWTSVVWYVDTGGLE